MAPNNNNNRKNNKKNRNKNKKKKASGGGVTGGGGTGGNNNHNNIPIPTVATASTISMTTEEMNHFVEESKLKGYPKSTYFAVGVNLLKEDHHDLALDAFLRGAKNDDCVGCMYLYVFTQHEFSQHKCNTAHLEVPWALEGAIRGQIGCMVILTDIYSTMTEPAVANALMSFWVKMTIELGDTNITEEERKDVKKFFANVCYVCGKEDSKDKLFEKCGNCKYYTYCGKNCQTRHWSEQNHIAECRQLQILREYCKSRHVKEIREAIIAGVDPKEIPRLQLLRTNLGLNRPKEEYEELLLHLGDDSYSDIQNRYKYLTARKDGTVHIGSTPEAI